MKKKILIIISICILIIGLFNLNRKNDDIIENKENTEIKTVEIESKKRTSTVDFIDNIETVMKEDKEIPEVTVIVTTEESTTAAVITPAPTVVPVITPSKNVEVIDSTVIVITPVPSPEKTEEITPTVEPTKVPEKEKPLPEPSKVPTPTVVPTVTPQPTKVPEPTVVPTVLPTPTVTPSPTPVIEEPEEVYIYSFITMDNGVKNSKSAEYVSEIIQSLPSEFVNYFTGELIITDDISKYDKYSVSGTQGLFLGGNLYIKEREDNNYLHVVSHEMSHNLDYKIGFELGYNYYMSGRDESWLDLFNRYEYINQEQGTYANVNHGEFFAEVYSDYLTNPTYVKTNFPELYEACSNVLN